jgi:hypothetical protein
MDEQNKPKPDGKTRRPYAKPEVSSFELFERRSLTCGPQANTHPPCGTIHQSVT